MPKPWHDPQRRRPWRDKPGQALPDPDTPAYEQVKKGDRPAALRSAKDCQKGPTYKELLKLVREAKEPKNA